MTHFRSFAGFAALALMAADTGTTTTAAPAADPKAKTVSDDMDSRRFFATPADAVNYLTKCGEEFSDFAKLPLAAVGVDDEGNFDPKVYDDSMRVMVATLRKAKAGVKAIVVAPTPTLESVLANPAAKEWLERIFEKELNHVAVRPIREASDVSTVVDQMPSTLVAYITSGRADGGMQETFNELYKQINDTIGKKVPVWAKARLTKVDFKRALENTGFAKEYYPSLENRGEGKKSLFVTALELGISVAKAKGLDPTIFERWTETRDAKEFKPGDDEGDEDNFDVDSLTESLMTEAKPVEATTAPTEQPAPPVEEPRVEEPAA